MFLHTKFQKSNFSLKLRLKYQELIRSFWLTIHSVYIDFWLFCLLYYCVFTHKIPKKSLFPQFTPIISGTFLTPNAQKVISPSNWPYNIEHFFEFLSDNLVCFYTQNSKKVAFPPNCVYDIGHFFDFFGFLHTKFQKNSSNYAYNIGHFFDLKRPKSDFPSNFPYNIEHLFDFFVW